MQPLTRPADPLLNNLQVTALSYVGVQGPVRARFVDELVIDCNGDDEFAAGKAADFLKCKVLKILPVNEASAHGSAPSPRQNEV